MSGVQYKEINNNPSDVGVSWTEASHQAYIVMELRRLGAIFRVGMEGIKLTKGLASKAKVAGLEAGEPDILIYGMDSRVLLIELKKWKGPVSKVQVERHKKLAMLGHHVHVVKERTPADSWNKVLEIINKEGIEL